MFLIPRVDCLSTGDESVPLQPELIERVLSPYFTDCRYVKSAELSYGATPPGALIPSDLEIEASLSIPKSCYIESTGHFNSVEFNLCFNQIGYLLLAQSIGLGLVKPFADWDRETFEKKQLPDILVVGLETTFRREIHAGDFRGRTHLHTMKVARGIVYSKWSIDFWDERGGAAQGKAFCCAKLDTGRA